jgi:hypothetical protein
MIIDCNSQYLFCIILSDHIFIKEFFDLYWFPDSEFIVGIGLVVTDHQLLLDYFTRMLHTILTNMSILAGN